MRPLLLVFWIASVCVAQVPASAPIPNDPYELVTGKVSVKPTNRAEALARLNKAKAFMRLLSPATPPYFLTASFIATGDPANSGQGEFTQLWLGQESWRWTAKFGDFSVSRVHARLGTFDEKPVALVPMRVHMLRNAIFWAAQGLTATSQFRSAAVEWNGHPTTCVLVSERPDAGDSATRRWDESEYCIDDETSLLQILSIAPGSYTVYSYGGRSFHGQRIPDRFKTYLNGVSVIDASIRIEEPSASVPALTAEMTAAGPPVTLDEPLKRTINVTDKSGASASVVVNAQIGPDGKVAAEELCVASDASLAARALDRVKVMEFGRSESQRQGYIEVRFVPESATSAASRVVRPLGPASVPTQLGVPIQPYYLERTVSLPPEPSDWPGVSDVKEIVARRSDGATVAISTSRIGKSGQHTRQLKFADGRSFTLYDDVKAKVTWPLLSKPEIDMLNSKSANPDCKPGGGRTLLLRHEQMEGVDVAVIETSSESFRFTTWEAPSLGCEKLYVKSERMNQDGSFRVSAETKATRLLIGEPDPRLFEIGPDLVEMKPSEAERRFVDSLKMDLDALGLSAQEKAILQRELEREVEREGADADKRYQGKEK
jgi:hypothetical protein